VQDLRELEINSFLAHAEMLAQLAQHPAWEGWTRLLHDMRQAALEELARGADPGDFRYWQGAAAALGEILDRPTRIITTAADYQRAEEADKGVIHTELRAAMGMGVDREGDL
jgi:hypothetical protein